MEILEAEFDVWTQLASTTSGPGAKAYTHKKACMYCGLAKESSEAYVNAWKEAGCDLSVPPRSDKIG